MNKGQIIIMRWFIWRDGSFDLITIIKNFWTVWTVIYSAVALIEYRAEHYMNAKNQKPAFQLHRQAKSCTENCLIIHLIANIFIYFKMIDLHSKTNISRSDYVLDWMLNFSLFYNHLSHTH